MSKTQSVHTAAKNVRTKILGIFREHFNVLEERTHDVDTGNNWLRLIWQISLGRNLIIEWSHRLTPISSTLDVRLIGISSEGNPIEDEHVLSISGRFIQQNERIVATWQSAVIRAVDGTHPYLQQQRWPEVYDIETSCALTYIQTLAKIFRDCPEPSPP